MLIYHITTQPEWLRAQAAGIYQADTLASQGFIHFSTREQVVATANRFYRGQTGLLLLEVAAERLGPPLIYENLEGGETLFPHLYGPLNLDAVEAVFDFPPGEDGKFTFPPMK